MKVRCTHCKILKDESYFSPNRGKKNNRNSWCKQCHCEAAKVYIKSIAGKQIKASWMKTDSLKQKSRMLLGKEVRAGKIVKEACFLCGEKNTFGHHLLYEFPLKVVWLCQKHHSAIHRKL